MTEGGAVAKVWRDCELAVSGWLHRHLGRSWLDRLMQMATHLGGVSVSCGVCALFWLLPSGRSVAGALTTAVAASHLVVQLLKALIRRARPYQCVPVWRWVGRPLADHAFPSGHTTAAFATAGVLSAAVPVAAIPLWSLAVLVGISRVYLGHHYPTDVLAGALIGAVSASLSTGFLL